MDAPLLESQVVDVDVFVKVVSNTMLSKPAFTSETINNA